MPARFNPPPGWPAPPSGWTPPPGWTPDPTWPPAPVAWTFWVDDSSQAPNPPTTTPPRMSASQPTGGLRFLGGPKKADLASEVEELRATLDRLGAGSAVEVARELDHARHDVNAASLPLS